MTTSGELLHNDADRRIVEAPATPKSPALKTLDETFWPEGAFGGHQRKRTANVWILPPGSREMAAAELEASASHLAQCSAEDLALLRSSRSRRRFSGGSALCSRSVAAAQNAVATAVAMARDVKTERFVRTNSVESTDSWRSRRSAREPMTTYFFSQTEDAATARRVRSRSPSPMAPDASSTARRRASTGNTENMKQSRRASSPSPTLAPQRAQSGPRSQNQVARTETTRADRASKPAQSSAVRRGASTGITDTRRQSRASSPTSTLATQRAHSRPRSQSPAARKDTTRADRALQPVQQRRARSQSPVARQPDTSRLQPPRVSARRRASSAFPANQESPEDLKRQIDALTRDLNRLKERHRIAVSHAAASRG